MKYFVPTICLLFLTLSCSKSDSNESETEKEPLVEIATLTTASISEITQTRAMSGGNISDDGGSDVTARGVCWSTSTNPTVNDSKTSDGSGKGGFSSSVENLEANTSYFLRSYASNSEGTAYGNEVSFKTLELQATVKTFEGDLILTSQQEIDEFGAQEYIDFKGNLTIKDSNSPSSIVSLAPLNAMVNIEGSLIIENNQALVNIEGFLELENVSKTLSISYNNNLELINAFDNLDNVGDEFIIYNENSVFVLSGLDKLKTVGGNFKLISNNSSKVSVIDAFPVLELITGNVEMHGIESSVSGFEKLRGIDGNFWISNTEDITNLSFLSSLEQIKGKITVKNNSNLKSLEGLEKLNKINNGISVLANPMLATVKGLENITTINGQVTFGTNLELISFDGLQNVENIDNGGLRVYGNASITNFFGLENLKTLDYGFEVSGNHNLKNFEGINNLMQIGIKPANIGSDVLSIFDNSSLENLSGLEGLNSAYEGSMEIKRNNVLANLDGLQNLENVFQPSNTVGNIFFRITDNSTLNDYCGLKKLYDRNSSRITFGIKDNFTPETSIEVEISNCN